MATPTVTRISPGIYEINGKRYKAATSADALKLYQTSITKTTAPAPTPTTTAPAPTTPAAPPPPPNPNTPIANTIDPATPGLTPEDSSAIERTKALLGIGENVGRTIGNEFYSDGSLGRVNASLTPDEVAAAAKAQALAGSAGTQSQSVLDLLNNQRGILGQAQGFSPLEQEALGVARDALPGLDAQSMQGLRSQAHDEINRQFGQQIAQLAKSQARNQVFGAAATAQNRLVGQDAVHAGRDLERDLLVKNIDIKQAAQNAFSNLATATETNRAGRTNAASNALSNTTLSDEAARRAAENSATSNYGTLASTLGDNLRKLQEFNLSQAAAEKAGQIGSIFGGIGTVTDQRGLLAGEDFANKQYTDSQAAQQKILDLIRQSLSQQKGALG